MKEIDERNAVARSEKNPFNHPFRSEFEILHSR